MRESRAKRPPRSAAWAELGSAIRERRRELKLTQQALAGGLVSRAQLTNVENGIESPSESLVRALEPRLAVKPNTLFWLYVAAVKADTASGQLQHVVRDRVVRRAFFGESDYYLLDADGKPQPARFSLFEHEPRFERFSLSSSVAVPRQHVKATVDIRADTLTTVVLRQLVVVGRPVRTIRLWRYGVAGAEARRVEFGIQAGGRVTQLRRWGAAIAHEVRLERTLRAGDVPLELTVVVRAIGLPAQPGGVLIDGHEDAGQSVISVEFANETPGLLWYSQHGNWIAGTGQPSRARRLHLAGGKTSHTFIGTDAHGVHGIEWRWVDLP